jgi:hypothetical protein
MALPKLKPQPARLTAEERYLNLLTSTMLGKFRSLWKLEAAEISRLLQESGLLPSPPRLTTPEQFLQDALTDNDLILENSNLPALMEARYRPEHATTAFEIASQLIPPESV